MRRRIAVLPLLLVLAAACAPEPTPVIAPDPVGLVVRLNICVSSCDASYRTVDYLADGTVIRTTPEGNLETATLTPTGLSTVRERLATDADLLTDPRFVDPRTPNMGPLMVQAETDTFILERPDGSRFTISTLNDSSPHSEIWAPSPIISRLSALADDLGDPQKLVGESGLAQPGWSPHEPALTAIFIRLSDLPPCDPNSLLGPKCIASVFPGLRDVGWPFGKTPGSIGTAFTGPNYERPGDPPDASTWRCAFLPTERIRAGIASMPVPGTTLAPKNLSAGLRWGSSGLIWDTTDPSMMLGLTAAPLLPEDAAASCATAHFGVEVILNAFLGHPSG